MESVAITNKNFRKDKKKNIHTLYVDADHYNSLRKDVVGASSTEKFSSYTLTLADNLKLVTVTTAEASTVTVPPESEVAWPEGAAIMICQGGLGQVTIVPGAGVTIHSEDSANKLTGQWATASLINTGTDVWLLAGQVE